MIHRLRIPVARNLSLGVSALALTLVAAAAPTRAQDGSGGASLRFGISQSLIAEDNAELDVTSEGTTVAATTGLSFGYLSQTRTSRLAIDAGLGFRVLSDPDTDGTEFDRTTPRVSLSYGQETRASALSLGASLSVDDVQFIDPLTDLENLVDLDGDGLLDFDELTGTGTRRAMNLNASLELLRDARAGLTLSASRRDLTYSDTTNPDLVDSTRTSLGATGRFDLNEAARASLGLRYSVYDEDGIQSRETLALNGDISFERPDGGYGFGISAADTTDGGRYGVSVSRNLVLPNGSLNASLGVTRAASSDYFVTGSLGYTAEVLPATTINARISRAVSSSTSDSETVRTFVSLSAARPLTPTANASLGLNFARSEDTDTGLATGLGTFNAGLALALTEDWSLNTGYRHEFRDEDGVGSATNNVVTLSISRSFVTRY